MESKNRQIHNFINKSLRIEIIQKLICEEIEQKKEPTEEFINDLLIELKEQISLIEEVFQRKNS